MSNLVKDLQYGVRMLLKSPGFTAVAVLTLALGIGANTALYSVANELLKSMPGVPHPEELVDVVGMRTGQEGGYGLLPYADYVDYRAAEEAFVLSAVKRAFVKITWKNDSALVLAEIVSGNYFDMLGVRPILGRTFSKDETEAAVGAPVAILGWASWQNRFGGIKEIVGRTVKLNGQPFTIIGVAPKAFGGRGRQVVQEFWVPTSAYDHLVPADAGALSQRGRAYWTFLGRLRPGVSLEQAQARVTRIAERLEQGFPSTNRGITARVLREDVGDPRQARVFRFAVFAFMGLGGLVLLVACGNVCNLFLARAEVRHREMAIRAALGAGRGRLLRQLLTESIVLAALGGLAGVLAAFWTLDLLRRWRPDVDIPITPGLVIDGGALAYAGLLLVLSTLFFGLVPALRLSSLHLIPAIKGDGPGQGSPRRLLSSGLVVAQVGTAFVLLIISGLLVQSLRAAERVELGFDPRNVLTARMDLSLEKYDKAAWQGLYRELKDRLAALPGVAGVSVSQGVPIIRSDGASFFVEGASGVEGDRQDTALIYADPDFFRTVRIPLLSGRSFEPSDDHTRPNVALVNRAFAERHWPGQNPLGRVLRLHETEGPRLEVIGVVADSKYNFVAEDRSQCVFVPLYQNDMPSISVLLRTTGEPTAWAPALRSVIKELNPEMLLLDVQPYERLLGQIGGGFFIFRLGASFASALASLALLLALLGLYGLIAFGVSQKTREVGVRMALGADSRSVLWLFVRRGLLLTAAGLAAGLLAAAAATRLITTYLYGVSAIDPATFVTVPLLFTGVALLASYLPARRATRVDPMVTLRCE
jgi:predicted permease